MRRITIVVVVVALSLLLTGPASAHPTTRFRACTVPVPGMCDPIGAAFIYGDVVVVKGRVRPVHGGLEALGLRKRPHGSVYREVGTVSVSGRGTMRFRWVTTIDDAVQDAPYRFRFRIRGHGVSNASEAYVLFGE